MLVRKAHPYDPVEELFDGDGDDVEEGVDTATPDHQKQKIKKPGN